MMKKIAVIGAGYWGKNLVRVMNDLGQLAAVCDADSQRRRDLQATYKGVDIVPSLDAILKNSDIKAVVIATPATSHYEIGKQALLSGKDVFIEKPLAMSVSNGEELVDIAEKNGRILFVGHVLHYHPCIVKMKEMIRRGDIGKVNYIYSNRLNLGKFRNEENILWSFAPHDISLILSILKEYPLEVYCTGGNYLHQKIADITLCTYNFNSGTKAHIFVSWLHPTKEQKLIVVGSNGMLVFDDTVEPDKKLAIYRHQVVWIDGLPNPKKNEPEYIRVDWEEPLLREAKAFLESIEKRTPPITNGQEGLLTLKLLNHSQQSLEKGEIIVTEPKGSSEKTLPFYIHPSSFADRTAQIGKGTNIWHFCNIMPGAVIGKNCRIGQNVFIAKNVKIGNGVKIQNNVSVYERVEIADFAFLGPSAVFTNVFNPRSEVERKNEYRVTKVGKGATVGANATIVCGVTIGDYAFVGAGAVVTHNVKPYSLVYGSPAQHHGWMCQCGEKLPIQEAQNSSPKKVVCSRCEASYQICKDDANEWKCTPQAVCDEPIKVS
ncbi:MAG: Gfo/Idh/MocA family oxidoreductase [Elusimicrobia bacterium]|nr:Gfo/Idh/MocA family oxidoreductase [Candidatus Obscuribacterium magneticum]